MQSGTSIGAEPGPSDLGRLPAWLMSLLLHLGLLLLAAYLLRFAPRGTPSTERGSDGRRRPGPRGRGADRST